MSDGGLIFLAALKPLMGLRLFNAGYAANMRTFGFCRVPVDPARTSEQAEWSFHISCSWRIECDRKIITGSFDWFEPAVPGEDPGEQWDPSSGGSLQEKKLRELFEHRDASSRVITNNTNLFVVEDVDVDVYGGVMIGLTGNYRLRVFPAGSRGEFWRIFEISNYKNYFVCELDTDARYSDYRDKD